MTGARTVLIAILLTGSQGIRCQYDRFAINVGLDIGIINYHTNELVDDFTYYSSIAFTEELHAANFQYQATAYKATSVVPQVGLYIPVMRTGGFSCGLDLNAGIGYQKQRFPKENGYDNDISISGTKIIFPLYAYARYSWPEYGVLLKGGMTHYNAFYKYWSPVASLELSYMQWSISLHVNLRKLEFYREFSNGEVELARSWNELGITLLYRHPLRE